MCWRSVNKPQVCKELMPNTSDTLTRHLQTLSLEDDRLMGEQTQPATQNSEPSLLVVPADDNPSGPGHLPSDTSASPDMSSIPASGVGAPELPNLNFVGEYDGNQSAGRWLARLRWKLKGKGTSVSQNIQAIDMLASGNAATFLDSHPEAQEIISKANAEVATVEDLKALEEILRDRYPARPIDEPIEEDDIGALAQKPEEPLAQYYARAIKVLRAVGGRDLPRGDGKFADSDSKAPLLKAEQTVLKIAIDKFVRGIRDERLRQEAILGAAIVQKSLWGCYEKVKDSQTILANRDAVYAELQDREQFEAFKKAMKEGKFDSGGLMTFRAHSTTVSQGDQQQDDPRDQFEVQTSLNQISSGPSSRWQAAGQDDQPQSKVCHNCGRPGHLARFCWQEKSGSNSTGGSQ